MLAAATAKSSLIRLLHAEHIVLFLTNLFLLTTIWTFIISSHKKKYCIIANITWAVFIIGLGTNSKSHWPLRLLGLTRHAWKIIVDLTLGQDLISHNNNKIDILCHLCKIFFGIQMHQQQKQRKNIPYLSSTIKALVINALISLGD